MRRGAVHKEKRGFFQAKFIIPIAFLLVGIIVAFGFLSREVRPREVPEAVIIRPGSGGVAVDADSTPVSSDPFIAAGPTQPNGADDPFANGRERVGKFKINSSALKRTVDKYASSRSNQCSGHITVRTEDTVLNVRSGPSTAHPVLSKAEKGSTQSVLLWAPDDKSQSGRWFLLVDDQKKTVKGWVSGEYCDAAEVVFPN